MNAAEFTVLIAIIWSVFLVIDLAGFYRRGPAPMQSMGARIASSYALSLTVHVGLFCVIYAAAGYYMVQSIPFYKGEAALSWVAGGVLAIVALVEGLRTRTDDTWLLRRWILEDLRNAENPSAHLEMLVAKIRSAAGEDSSQKALVVLREISRRGDSIGTIVLTELEKAGLL